MPGQRRGDGDVWYYLWRRFERDQTGLYAGAPASFASSGDIKMFQPDREGVVSPFRLLLQFCILIWPLCMHLHIYMYIYIGFG